MAFISIVVCHCKSTKTLNHTSTPSITYFCKTEYLVHIKVKHVRGQQIIFHLLIWLFYLLYCNITSLTSPIITLALLFITYLLQNGIFLPWLIVAWPKPHQPDRFLRPCIVSQQYTSNLTLCFMENKIHFCPLICPHNC